MQSLNYLSKSVLNSTLIKAKSKIVIFDEFKIFYSRISNTNFMNYYKALEKRTFKISNYHNKILANKRSYSTKDYLATNIEDVSLGNTKSEFQNMLAFRKNQAECSILLEILSKEEIPYVISFCQKHGEIKDVFTFSSESNTIYLLVEFTNKNEAFKLLQISQFRNINDSFPTFSRLLSFERKNFTTFLPIENNLDDYLKPPPQSKIKISNASHLIEEIYISEKLSELSIRLRFFFCILLKDAVSGMFPYCDVLPFGSTVNGVGKDNCDLDVMIRLYPEKIDNSSEIFFMNKTCPGETRILQQRAILSFGELIRMFLPGVYSAQKIIHARMPILKFRHKILGFDCDLSVNNMSAVLMSELLYFYGEIDSRFRPLVYVIKKWAKEANITYETPGTWITNFSLTLLVLFFLQTRPKPILPPLNDVIKIVGEDTAINFGLEYLKTLSECRAQAVNNKESLANLLKEFLVFLGTYPFNEMHISVLTGQALTRNTSDPLWLQYPFDENKNVAKNVSESEMQNMVEIASRSARNLAANINYPFKQTKDLMTTLGIQNLQKNYSNKIDINMLFNNGTNKKKAFKRRLL